MKAAARADHGQNIRPRATPNGSECVKPTPGQERWKLVLLAVIVALLVLLFDFTVFRRL